MLLQAHATHLSSDELLQRGTLLRTQGNVVFKQVTWPDWHPDCRPVHTTCRSDFDRVFDAQVAKDVVKQGTAPVPAAMIVTPLLAGHGRPRGAEVDEGPEAAQPDLRCWRRRAARGDGKLGFIDLSVLSGRYRAV